MNFCNDGRNPHTESQRIYDEFNTRSLHLKLNLNTDKDILNWLKRQQSMQGSIKRLIREEIQRERMSSSSENSDSEVADL